VILPARPGVLSAFGILVSDAVKDFSRTLLWNISNGHSRAKLETEFRRLEAAARKEFRAEKWAGAVLLQRSLDLRYRGQGYELNVPAKGDAAARFHQEHQYRYGYHHPGKEIELVTVRLRGKVKAQKMALGESEPKSRRTGRAKPVEIAAVIFQGRSVTTRVYERSDLIAGASMKGPAIITEYSATTVVPPGKTFSVDRAGNLLIAIR
jgi:N-methylhydantoinase A